MKLKTNISSSQLDSTFKLVFKQSIPTVKSFYKSTRSGWIELHKESILQGNICKPGSFKSEIQTALIGLRQLNLLSQYSISMIQRQFDSTELIELRLI